ncbi:hypothetical protein E2493_09765 [Sphingomonas parva]|uniref:Uncharacterized protein n=1 Tax=Sphingomonas parva TaxID=2555898 RepID=A0A4Y8ZQY5_9SPHN|nr:hypothetical protein [Sphingomonas parva]TFI58413.1 hypothetical protein E2493_09765 [Sphingomonas parva]
MADQTGRVPAEELRRRAAHYRRLARECAYPEGVDLLLLMADVHDDEAAAAAGEVEGPFMARPTPSAG